MNAGLNYVPPRRSMVLFCLVLLVFGCAGFGILAFPASAQPCTPISPGSFDGQIRGSSVVCYTFPGSENEAMTIRMEALAGSSLDPLLELLGPNDQLLVADDDGGGGRNSLIRYTLPVAGLYRINARSYSGGSSGLFRLSFTRGSGMIIVLPLARCGEPMRYGDRKAGVISSIGAWCEYSFSGQSGDTVEINMRLTSSNSNLDPWLDLRGPNGTILVSDDDSGGGRNSRIRYRLPSSGTYTIVAKAYQGGSAGPFELTLSRR